MFRCSLPARNGQAKPIVLVAIFFVCAGSAVWLWTRPASQPSPSEGQAVAEAFLKELREGRPEVAWEATTAEFKSARGKERFVREVKPDKSLREPHEFVAVQTVKVQDQDRSEFTFRSAAGQTIRLVVGRDGGAWKVDRWLQ